MTRPQRANDRRAFGKNDKSLYNKGMRALLSGLFMIVAVAGAAGVGAQQTDTDVKEELESGLIATPLQRAEYYLKAQEWGKLRAHVKKWVRDYPGESNAWRYLGLAHKQAGETTEAADAFVRAWELSDRKDYKVVEDIGDVYMQTEEWVKAEAAYRQATEIRSARAELWYKLSRAIMARPFAGQAQVAAPVLEKTLLFGQYVNSYELWRQYAEVLDEIGLDTDAQDNAYRHVVRLNPGDIAAWERLYEIARMRGSEYEVKKIIKKLFRLDAQNVYANLYYGKRALKFGRDAKAREYYGVALQSRGVSDGQRSEIYLALAETNIKPAEALVFYQRAIVNDPTVVLAWQRAIVILRSSGRRKEAQQYHEALGVVERRIGNNKPLPADLLKKLNLTAR